MPNPRPTYDLVIAANRLPVDKVVTDDGEVEWRRSPGGLVTAMESVMRTQPGAWVGWAGDAGDAPEPFDEDGIHLHPVALSADEVRDYYEGFSNDTLWPIYHDVIVPATFHRDWWSSYQTVNQRFAEAVAEVAAEGAHGLGAGLPAAARAGAAAQAAARRAHRVVQPHPLPARRALRPAARGAPSCSTACSAPTSSASSARPTPATSSAPADSCSARRRSATASPSRARTARSAPRAIPISVDFHGLEELARSGPTSWRGPVRSAQSLGDPEVLMLGVDRLDYTKGIRHRLKAYEELLSERRDRPARGHPRAGRHPQPRARRRLPRSCAARSSRPSVASTASSARSGAPAVHYLHHSYPREEMAALFQAADVMLVTPLRDGMNLVAKEYVTCRHDLGGALVLSEFTGAWHELHQAFACNPHDIEGLKQTILRAINTPAKDKQRIMKALRRRVSDHDVQRWAARYLAALAAAPDLPQAEPRTRPHRTR